MRSPLTLAVAQPRCHPYDVVANVAEHASIVAQAGARVVVFPELSLTGYHFDAAPLATDDPRMLPLLETCAAHEAIALIGAPVTSNGNLHIGMIAVSANGADVVYHKMYLGAAEEARFAAGTKPAVLDVDGWRIGTAVCKDTGVAAQAEATAALGVDVYAAGVLETTDDADVQPERAKAIIERHRMWVAIASFAGSTGDGYDQAAGGSAVWAPDGTLVASAGTEVGAWATAVITDPR